MKTFEEYCSDNQYAVSIKEDTAYLCPHFTRNHEEFKLNTSYPGEFYTPFSEEKKSRRGLATMDNPNITMEEYIRLEEEKARKCGKVFNWETAKYDFLTEPTLSPQHINEFDLKDETSLSECDEVEQNVLYFNDLFPFNIIYLDNLQSDKDNDDNKIDIIQSLGGMAPLPPHEQRHPFLRYQGLEYSDRDIVDFEERLERIYDRDTHRVQVLDFEGMPELMMDVLYARMLMAHRDNDRVVVFTSQAWDRIFETRGPLIRELILEFLSTLRFREVLLDLDTPSTIQFLLGGARRRMSWREFILVLGLHTGEKIESLGFARYWSESDRMIPRKGDLRDYWRDISTDGDFLGPPPFYNLIRDPMIRLCHRMMVLAFILLSQTRMLSIL
ncbi:hypothetical protein Tco_1119454 [Tanacetum coccineum]